MVWGALASQYAELLEEREHLRRQRAGSTALGDVAERLRNCVSRGAAALNGSREEAEFITAALHEPDGPRHFFVIEVLTHRKQFPLAYALPVVRAGVERGQQGAKYVRAASSAAGPTKIWQYLGELVTRDELSPDRAEYLAYYIGERRWSADSARAVERQQAAKVLKDAIVEARNRANRRTFR